MPIFMDLHIGQGLTAEDVAHAHRMDLDLQGQFNCKCLTYWVDEERGNAYCLVNAPNKEAVIELHNNTHKSLPDEIIEVDERVVKAFLGRTHDPQVVDYMVDGKIKVFNDPAFRILLKMSIADETLLTNFIGSEKSKYIVERCKLLFKNIIVAKKGNLADGRRWNFLATFHLAQDAHAAATQLQKELEDFQIELQLGISIHAGNPVTSHPEFFGKCLEELQFLTQIAKPGEIIMTDSVNKTLPQYYQPFNVQMLTLEEERFISKLVDTIAENYTDTNSNFETLLGDLGYSKSTFYRMATSITGLSPNRILRDFRLYKAKELLINTKKNVSEVAFETGFNSASYFSKCFHKKYGIPPTQYR